MISRRNLFGFALVPLAPVVPAQPPAWARGPWTEFRFSGAREAIIPFNGCKTFVLNVRGPATMRKIVGDCGVAL